METESSDIHRRVMVANAPPGSLLHFLAQCPYLNPALEMTLYHQHKRLLEIDDYPKFKKRAYLSNARWISIRNDHVKHVKLGIQAILRSPYIEQLFLLTSGEIKALRKIATQEDTDRGVLEKRENARPIMFAFFAIRNYHRIRDLEKKLRKKGTKETKKSTREKRRKS